MTDKRKGFSMLEMIIVIAIIAILASLITPLAVNYITQKRYDVCNDELKILKQAIIGDATLIEGGIRSSFGFVGDLGQLPLSLTDLISRGSMPLWQQSSYVWFGWRGPYVSDIKDPWGKNYYYTNNWQGNTPVFQSLNPVIATIWSAGQDGVSGNSDDVSISIRLEDGFSMISGNTLDQCGAAAAFTGIRFYYPAINSIISTVPVNTLLNSPHYNVQTAIPIGVRYMSVGTPAMNKLVYINNGPLIIENLRTPGACN